VFHLLADFAGSAGRVCSGKFKESVQKMHENSRFYFLFYFAVATCLFVTMATISG